MALWGKDFINRTVHMFDVFLYIFGNSTCIITQRQIASMAVKMLRYVQLMMEKP